MKPAAKFRHLGIWGHHTNFLKSGLAKRPCRYRWSSTATYLCGKDDPLVKVCGLHEMVDDWSQFFREGVDFVSAERLRRHERTGRALGSENFVVRLEKILGRMLRPKKAGRKPKKKIRKDISSEEK